MKKLYAATLSKAGETKRIAGFFRSLKDAQNLFEHVRVQEVWQNGWTLDRVTLAARHKEKRVA
jgi:hypothetical protein